MSLRVPPIRSAAQRRWIAGYLLCLPAFLLIFGLLVYPMLSDLWVSLTDASGFGANGQFVGLANYAHLVRDPLYWTAARNALVLVVVTAAVEFAVGLATAVLLWWRFWGRGILFLAVFIPWAFPSSFAGYAWYWLLLPPFTSFYTGIAIHAKAWLNGMLGEGAWEVLSIALMNVWRGSSIIAIFLLAGFNAIPQEMLDYGRLEARSRWRYLWRVVLPLNRRMVVLALAIALTITYLDFVSIYPATGGRITIPLVGTLAYQSLIIGGQTAMASALIITQLPVAVLLGVFALRFIERDRRTRGPAADRGPVEGGAGLQEVPSPGPLPAEPLRWPAIGGRRLLQTGGLLSAMVVFGFYLFPIYYTAVQAVRPLSEYARGQIFWAYHPDFSSLVNAVDNRVFWTWTSNTFIVFGAVLAVGLVASIAAGYGLARFAPPSARWLARLLFCTYFVPQVAVIKPLYRLYQTAGLDNTLLGIVLIYLTLVIPFSTWLFYSWFLALDPEIEAQALLDAHRLKVFLRVLLPMSWPVLVAAGLFGVGMIGSDILYAGLFSLTNATRTLPAGLGLTAIDLDEWSNVNAAILLASFPQIVACAALGHSYVRGLRAALLEGG